MMNLYTFIVGGHNAIPMQGTVSVWFNLKLTKRDNGLVYSFIYNYNKQY